jgi:phospholipid transport system substrate-binding protein
MNMTTRRNYCAVVAVIVGLAAGAMAQNTAPPATAPSPAGANANPPAVIASLTKNILEVLRDKSIDKVERRKKVREIAYQYIDMDTLARLAMGQHWRTLNADQQKEFVAEFRQHLANTYGHTTDEYTDEDIKPAGDQQESNGDWTVRTKILGTENGARKEVAKVDYRLRKRNDVWKIIDVTIDNVSLMGNFRSQFQDIMTSGGGFNQLIKALKDKNASGDK